MTRIGSLTLPDASELNADLARLKASLRQANYSEAVRLASALVQQYPLFVPALVSLATAVQLSDNGAGYSLEDCRALLSFAAYLEEQCGDATHECARFLFSVEDNTPEAIEVAARARDRKKREVFSLVVLLVEALRESGKHEKAEAALREARRIFPDADELVSLSGSDTSYRAD